MPETPSEETESSTYKAFMKSGLQDIVWSFNQLGTADEPSLKNHLVWLQQATTYTTSTKSIDLPRGLFHPK